MSASRFLTASLANQGFLIVLLALHALGWVVLSSPFREAIAAWAAMSVLALPWVLPRRGGEPPVQLKICPYCEDILTVGAYECPKCGELSRKEVP